jgi:hypothetical protein
VAGIFISYRREDSAGHAAQFESAPAVIRCQSEVGADEIAFAATDDFGIAKGVARRAPPSP